MDLRRHQRPETVPLLPGNVEILPKPYKGEGEDYLRVFSMYTDVDDSAPPESHYHAFVIAKTMGVPTAFTSLTTEVLGKVGDECTYLKDIRFGLVGPYGIEFGLQRPRIAIAARRASRLVEGRLRAMERATNEYRNSQ